MKIRQKLIIGFVIISLLVGLVGFIGLYANNQVVLSFEKGEKHFGNILEASNEVSSYSKRAQGHTMLYLTLHNVTDRKKAGDRIASLREEITILDEEIKNPDAMNIVNDTESRTDEMQTVIGSLISIHDTEMEKTGAFDFKEHEALIRKLDSLSSKIRQNGLDLMELELELEADINNKAEERANSLYGIVFMIGGIALISAMAIGLVFDKNISVPIDNLKNAVTSIRKGNLSTKIDILSNDEIGELSGEFNKMAEDLQISKDEIISSKEYTDNIVYSMNDSLIVVSKDSVIQKVNKAAALLLGYSEKDLIGQPISKIIQDGEKIVNSILDHKNEKSFQNVEMQYISRDQKKIIVIFSASSMHDKKGEIIGIVCMAQDITERKIAEEQVMKSLEEKEVLLREIHHRVKNNMQIISSLLNHQMENIKDKNIIKIFIESQNRILSLALVHEKLYQSRDLRNIDFKEYVNDLGANLFQSYGIRSGNVKLNMDIEDISLDIDLAIPLGLIINELITNSLKYAFPDDTKGEINISFKPNNDHMFELIAGDNGIGLPAGMDFRNTESLGLHLVTLLAENQLHGKIDLVSTRGTQFRIKFKG